MLLGSFTQRGGVRPAGERQDSMGKQRAAKAGWRLERWALTSPLALSL